MNAQTQKSLGPADINRILSKEYENYIEKWKEAERTMPGAAGQKLRYLEYLEFLVIALRQNLQKSEFINDRFGELMDLFPPCPDGMKHCIPHAMEWVKAHTEEQSGGTTEVRIGSLTKTIETTTREDGVMIDNVTVAQDKPA
jgi:hypothetical protein